MQVRRGAAELQQVSVRLVDAPVSDIEKPLYVAESISLDVTVTD